LGSFVKLGDYIIGLGDIYLYADIWIAELGQYNAWSNFYDWSVDPSGKPEKVC
jgi:hypothetical protein